MDVGGFINRAVAVIELFFPSILNLKLLKQNKYSRATTVSYVFQNYCLCNAPSHPPTCTNEKIIPFRGSDKYMNFGLMLLQATGL